jgi:hypothetical protein
VIRYLTCLFLTIAAFGTALVYIPTAPAGTEAAQKGEDAPTKVMPPAKEDAEPPMPMASPPGAAAGALPDDGEFKEMKIPDTNKVAGLTLTPDQTVSAAKRFAIVRATTDKPDQKVRWIVLGALPGLQPSSLVSPSGRSILIFPAGYADLIVVMAYSSTADGPTDVAVSKLAVEGPLAPSPQQPATKPPVTGKLHVTVVIDLAKQTPELAAMRASKAFRDFLGKENCVYHECNPATVPADIGAALKKAGLPYPAVVIQNAAGDIEEKATFLTAEDVTGLVERVRGK